MSYNKKITLTGFNHLKFIDHHQRMRQSRHRQGRSLKKINTTCHCLKLNDSDCAFHWNGNGCSFFRKHIVILSPHNYYFCHFIWLSTDQIRTISDLCNFSHLITSFLGLSVLQRSVRIIFTSSDFRWLHFSKGEQILNPSLRKIRALNTVACFDAFYCKKGKAVGKFSYFKIVCI